MAMSNRDRVGTALELLSTALEPFCAQVLRPHLSPGTTWTDVLKVKDGEKGGGARVYEPKDVQVQLRVITEKLGALGFPFSSLLSRGQQNLAGELREVRDKWAHQSPFGHDDTYRALDTAERLLRAVNAGSQADEVRKQRQSLQRAEYEQQTRRDTKPASATVSFRDDDLQPWMDVLTPHPDVVSGRFRESEFAADLHEVAHGVAHEGSREYHDPVEFFRRTFLTAGLKDLLARSARRIAGDRGEAPVVNLQTTFGGGKTHSMLAVWHLLSGTPVTDFPQDVQEIVHGSGLSELGNSVRRAAVVGINLSPGQPDTKPDGTVVRTIWGEIAWQLGGAAGFAMIAESDRTAKNPGAALRELIAKYAPCVILIDEWVAYARQLPSNESVPAGDFETQFTFAQTLTEAVKAAQGALLLVSIPASDVRLSQDGSEVESPATDLETGGTYGLQALARLQHVVGRVAHQWQAASATESFEIVRRRLFSEPDGDAIRAIAATARKFSGFYRSHAGEFPTETRDSDYETRLRSAYPIHPELFDRLYGDWSTLERFQRTRGVLRLMSAVVQRLVELDDKAPLIMPGSVPLSGSGVLSEIGQYLDDAWKAVIHSDVDGQGSLPERIDEERPLFGRRALTERIARTVLIGSAATLRSAHKGIERQRVFLGVAMPGDTVGNFGSSLQMLSDRATYLFAEGERYWFDTQPSLNRYVADKAAALSQADVDAEVVLRLRRAVSPRPADFVDVLVAPTSTGDVPEGEGVRLVLLHPSRPVDPKVKDSPGLVWSRELFGTRGSAPRERRNTLVTLAPDKQRLAELDSAVRSYLAWKDTAARIDELDLTPANAGLVRRRQDETNRVVDQRVTTTWIHAIVPVQPDGGAPFDITLVKADGDEPRLDVRTGRRLVKDDHLRVACAPAAVRLDLDLRLAKVWNNGRVGLGELWDLYTRYPYLSRLRDRSVLEERLTDVLSEMAFVERGFALATGYDESTGEFTGLAVPLEDHSFGPLTDSTLLVAPDVALAQRRREREREAATVTEDGRTDEGDATVSTERSKGTPARPQQVVKAGRYVGRWALDSEDPDVAGDRLRAIGEEIVRHLAIAEGVDQLEVVVEINAETSAGFTDATRRTVSENARSLRFDESGFEDVPL
ncbi:MAG: hypothetical protein QOJ72_795 [Nocardioidaceae bacterium]|jgi:hypothetical protein|nr:hypothetical protein [Nocardioidaceae bacterium]